MNKKELIDAVAAKVEFKKKDIEEILEQVIATIEDTVASDEKVSITGFGVFEKVETKGREGKINFGEKKGQTYKTEDGFKPKFSSGKEFKEKVAK